MDCAEILGLRFAYATNGNGIVEFDFTTSAERELSNSPTPAKLWPRLRHTDGPEDDGIAERLLAPGFPDRAKPLRYYQEIAVNRIVQAVLQGRRRALLTLCTGAGKTVVAFQICWKLWQARLNAKGDSRQPKEPLIWRFFLGFAAEFALPGCTGRFSAVRKPQMRVFGAKPPPVQPPQGWSGKFRTHFSPVIASAAGQSSGSRSPEAAQAAARSSPNPDTEPCRSRTPA